MDKGDRDVFAELINPLIQEMETELDDIYAIKVMISRLDGSEHKSVLYPVFYTCGHQADLVKNILTGYDEEIPRIVIKGVISMLADRVEELVDNVTDWKPVAAKVTKLAEIPF